MRFLLLAILLGGWLMVPPIITMNVETMNSKLSGKPVIWIQDSTQQHRSKGVNLPLFDFGGSANQFKVEGVHPKTMKPHLLTLDVLSSDPETEKPMTKPHVINSNKELVSMSEVKNLLHDLIPSCNAISEGPKIIFLHCPGDLAVITIAGTMKMGCNQIEKRTFYGPVILKNSNCQQSFIFDRDCANTLRAGIESSACDPNGYHVIIWIQAGLIIVLILVSIYVGLWVMKYKRGVKIGECQAKLSRAGWFYTTDYEEYVTSDGAIVRSLIRSETELNAVKKHYTIHILRFALLILLCRPLSVNGFSLMKQYDAMKMNHVYSIVLADSETIHMGSSMIKREPMIFSAQVMPLFKTASWTLDHKDNYFCQWSSCDSIANCGLSTLPFRRGNKALNSNLGFGRDDDAYTTCMKIYGYCSFGWGCKMMGFKVKYNKNKLYSVFSISSGGSHGGVITVPPGCIIENLVDSSSGAIKGYYLVSDNRENSWFCHESVFSKKPVSNLLGDLQLFPDGTESFMAQDIHCVPDWDRPSVCTYPEPFISSIEELCHRPSEFGMTVIVDIKNSLVTWKQSGTASISVKCDRELPLPIEDVSCSDVSVRLWEISNLNSIILLSFVGQSHNPNAVFRFPKSVYMKSSEFRCDGTVYFTELYDVRSLNSTGMSFTQHTVPYEKIDMIQHDHFSTSSSSTFLPLTWRDEVTNWLPIIVTVTIVFLMVCILSTIKKLIS